MICYRCAEAADKGCPQEDHCGKGQQWCTCQHKVPLAPALFLYTTEGIKVLAA